MTGACVFCKFPLFCRKHLRFMGIGFKSAIIALTSLFSPLLLHAGASNPENPAEIIRQAGQQYGEREFFRYRSYRLKLPDERWSVRIGAGMPSAFAPFKFTPSSSARKKGEVISDYYRNYHGPAYDSGCYSIGAEYYFARWFSLAADFCIEGLWMDLFDRHTDTRTGTDLGIALSLMPQAKFVYLHRPMVRVYSSIGIGATGYIGFDSKKDRYIDETGPHCTYGNALSLTIQFTAIGVEVGRKFFGFAEIGTGALYSGIRAGAGYKF